jgi:hypothetical protein
MIDEDDSAALLDSNQLGSPEKNRRLEDAVMLLDHQLNQSMHA